MLYYICSDGKDKNKGGRRLAHQCGMFFLRKVLYLYAKITTFA